MIVDNCSAHPKVELNAIKPIFLSANTTSIIQPMDQGIIKNWKGHFRSALNKQILIALDAHPSTTASTITKKFTLLDAVYLAHKSWDHVKIPTIRNGFHRAGFTSKNSTEDK